MGYRKQLSFRTECLNSMFNTRKRYNSKIEQEHRKSIHYRMARVYTPAEKRRIIAETNQLFYVFGETRKVYKPYLTYAENFDVK
jgi:hypothetical protein